MTQHRSIDDLTVEQVRDYITQTLELAVEQPEGSTKHQILMWVVDNYKKRLKEMEG